jgi:proteasome accessory factor B
MKRPPAKPREKILLSRPPVERMLQIHHAIQAGKFPNASKLAAQFEVSRKSIQRDLAFMRDRLSLPIEYDGARWGYYYSQEVSAFPTLQISEGEVFALLVAEKALQQYRGTTFERPLRTAFAKMASSLPENISLNLSEWDQTISFRTSVEPVLNLKVFDTISRATARHQQLRIRYRKPGQSDAETRVVDPYHLGNINGEWFLFAFDHLRNAVRTFVPARILDVELTGKKFKVPQGFSIEQQLRGSFGVHSGAGHFDVRIRFSAKVADFIREKKWHASQKLHDARNGAVELRLRLSSLVEVERWILSWGGEAIALAPSELVASVKTAAAAITANHPA